MRPAYQHFLDFFSLAGRERLDGLDASYFEPMTKDERQQAFNYLLQKVRSGGTAESVHGLFLADPSIAARECLRFIEEDALRPEADVAAAWSLHRLDPDADVLAVFIRHLESPDPDARQVAASHLPTGRPIPRLLEALKGLILTDMSELTQAHAVSKLLVCHGISESADRRLYATFYRQLRGDHAAKQHALEVLTEQYPLASR